MKDEYNKCPECGSENIEELIGYTHGHKIGEGWKCNDCDWEVVY